MLHQLLKIEDKTYQNSTSSGVESKTNVNKSSIFIRHQNIGNCGPVADDPNCNIVLVGKGKSEVTIIGSDLMKFCIRFYGFVLSYQMLTFEVQVGNTFVLLVIFENSSI